MLEQLRKVVVWVYLQRGIQTSECLRHISQEDLDDARERLGEGRGRLIRALSEYLPHWEEYPHVPLVCFNCMYLDPNLDPREDSWTVN
jgi:hypothetical protein